MKIKAALFDVIGTTVKEKTPDTVATCFIEAFSQYGIEPDSSVIRANRGKDKLDMINRILENGQHPEAFAPAIYAAFKKNLTGQLDQFEVYEGVTEIFLALQNAGIKTGLGSGLPRDVFAMLFSHLKFDKIKLDYIGLSEEIGRSRPHPDMIFDMMRKISMTDNRAFLKIGDTVADIEEGKNAGVLTAAVLSGTQSEEALVGAQPDYLLKEVVEVMGLCI